MGSFVAAAMCKVAVFLAPWLVCCVFVVGKYLFPLFFFHNGKTYRPAGKKRSAAGYRASQAINSDYLLQPWSFQKQSGRACGGFSGEVVLHPAFVKGQVCVKRRSYLYADMAFSTAAHALAVGISGGDVTSGDENYFKRTTLLES